MAELVLHDITRRFKSGGGVRTISLAVERGEFFVLLGPSGSGKSTLLRLIAGLEAPETGEIEIDGARVDHSGGSRGSVAMVFQNYALYPHMTAFDNIAFALKLMRLPAPEIASRVARSAQLSGLAIELKRYPAELSGGERQRVALARALVREPKIILLDEPLSNLDAKLRASLRAELKQFQRRTGRTFVYVTHDQLEALTLADRLAVMRDGGIEQIGRPAEVYARPANEFVASFLGQPPMNLIRARVSPDRAALIVGDTRLEVAPPAGAGTALTLGLRPEDLTTEPGEGKLKLKVTVENIEFSGARFVTRARLGNAGVILELSSRVQPGQIYSVYVDPARIHFFDPATTLRLN